MIKRKTANYILIGLFVAMALSLILPMYTGTWPEGEASGNFMFRGYEILFVSPLCGAVVFATIFISLVTLTTRIGLRKKCIILFPVNFANMAFYLASSYEIKMYLYGTAATNIEEAIGLRIFISIIALALILPFLLEKNSRPVSTYDDATLLCEEFLEKGYELQDTDETGYGLFTDVVFWANEYSKQLAMLNAPGEKENSKSYDATGATQRKQEHLSNCKETYLGDLSVLFKDHIKIRSLDAYLPDDEHKLGFACYLSLYVALNTVE